jgi:rhamnose transport system substrate-binding protein
MKLAKLLQQLILALILAIEIAIFAKTGDNFFTTDNFFTVCRYMVPLGLLALAMTPVILTGGIDLSVGSSLGLCAVVFGKVWQDYNFSPAEAAGLAILVGIAGGALNGLLITRLSIPPLIVTLGSYSLYRGLAIGITSGSENYSGFPDSFTYWGTGTFFGNVPVSVPILLFAAIYVWLLVHRGAMGRALSAIGYAPQGARYAGIRVNARTAMVYVLSGLAAGIAAILYVANVGQATADAGSGYELKAITAVVLGGTSIFGGRASVTGTVLGLFAIAFLENGLSLSDRPTELTGILTGVLLLLAIGLDTLFSKLQRRRA